MAVTMMVHSPGNHQARAADGDAQWRARRCSGTRASRSARTSTATCRCCDTDASSTGSIWGGRSQFYFSVRGTWDRMPAVKIRYLLLKSFHSFLPWCLSDMLSWYLSSILGDFSCNSDWNYQQLETETSSLPTVREHRLLTQFGICSLKIHFGSNKRIHAEC